MQAQTIGTLSDPAGDGDNVSAADIQQAWDDGEAAGNALNDLFGGGPSRWDNAGEGVHEWFTQYGPQLFLDWMATNYPDSFGSVDQCMALMPLWFRTRPYGIDYLIRPSDHYSANASRWWYSNPLTANAYAVMGIDYFASLAASPNPNANATFVPLNNGQITADAAELLVDTANGPRPANMSDSDWEAVQDAAADVEAQAGTDGATGMNTALLVGGGLSALFMLTR